MYVWGIQRQLDKDPAVMSQMFPIFFYMKIPVEKHVTNYFRFFFFSFLRYIWKKKKKKKITTF